MFPGGGFREPVNTTPALVMGIISIVLGATSCAALIGLILGIIGFVKAKAAKDQIAQGAPGNANAAYICSLIGIIVSALMLVVGVIAYFTVWSTGYSYYW